MSTYLDTPQAQQGRDGGSDDSAAAAEHSADIADMVAIRAESHAGRTGGWARDAQHYAVLAEIRSSTAQLGGDRATAAAREVWHTVAIGMLALGFVFGIALSVAVDDAVVRIVHNTVGITQERIVHDTRAVQSDSLMPSEGPCDKDAVPGGSAMTSPGPTTWR